MAGRCVVSAGKGQLETATLNRSICTAGGTFFISFQYSVVAIIIVKLYLAFRPFPLCLLIIFSDSVYYIIMTYSITTHGHYKTDQVMWVSGQDIIEG